MKSKLFALLFLANGACTNSEPTARQSGNEHGSELGEAQPLAVSEAAIARSLNLIRQQRVFDFGKVSNAQHSWESYVEHHCSALARNGDGMVSVSDCRAEKASARALELAKLLID